jgi:hypothetical protein
MKLNTVRQLVCGLAVLLSTSNVWAQKWAEDMFDKLEHDFGVVARGADAKYRLAITNKYKPDVHIASVRTSCGCTAAKPSQDTIKSLEKAYIELTMDTKKFTLQKDSSVTITFDQPKPAEVRIPVKAFIRSDVVLTPGGIEFGPITKGTDAERKISIAFAGRDNWTIRNVISKNAHVAAKVVQTGRGGGRVAYDLLVTAKGDLPIGEFREQLTLVTDDPSNQYIPVLVDGRVEREYTVNPELVDFGTLAPGAKKTVNVIIRGKKPFTIEKIESESTDMFEVQLPAQARPIHVLPLTLNAPTESGTLKEEFTVTINGAAEKVSFRAHGKIVGAPASSSAAKATIESVTAQSNP